MVPKISSTFGKAEETFNELRSSLIGLEKDKENGERLRKELNNHWEDVKRTYHSYVNPSIVDSDDKLRIMARYYHLETTKDPESNITLEMEELPDPYHIIEVFKDRRPPKMTEYFAGYFTLLDGKFEEGSNICRLMGINYGQDSAPRYLWSFLNKLADKNGVEHPNVFYETLE